MHRLGFLTPVSLLVLAAACSRENPAFDDCETESCVGETVASGDGDGDPSGDGDGDGDGEVGDGDGDGDGDAGDGDGDGDGETGDGDGDGETGLPSCPDAEWVAMPLLKDTFLDNSTGDGPCIVDWDFDMNMPSNSLNLAECNTLDFGGSAGHWACSVGPCDSLWLGRYDLQQWLNAPVQVVEAELRFTAKYKNAEPNAVLAYELDVANVDFGDCGDWHAGDGKGEPPTDCVTTFLHAAHPHLWPVAPSEQLLSSMPIAGANLLPTGDEYVEHMFAMPVDPDLVHKWLTGEKEHEGVLLSSDAWLPTQFYLLAQGSGSDPELHARMCEL